MRFAILTLAAFLCLAAAPALAHDFHDSCSNSRTVVNSAAVHVDVYSRPCVGATVTSPFVRCGFGDIHLLSGVHNPVLHGDGCETGVLLEPLP